MSASNYAICPRCVDKAHKAHRSALDDVYANYGLIHADEFTAQIAAIQSPKPEDFRTLREDYEFYGAEEGTVTVDYGCYCEVCELCFALKEHHDFYP